MRQTLFLIPHEFAGWPVFGVGWVLAIFVLAVAIRLGWAVWDRRRADRLPADRLPAEQQRRAAPLGPADVIAQQGIFWACMVGLILFVTPRLELIGPTGDPVGVAIRGYGMFLMLAAVASVGVAAWRANRYGRSDVVAGPNDTNGRSPINADAILQMAPWTFISGLVGARLFYLMQYYRDFMRPTWVDTITSMAALTQGGLVVYGGFIGGFVVSAWFVLRRGWSVWKFGDVIIPCVFIGLFFGRLGCLMNGCCFGGACDPGWLSAEFPPGSPVYREQMLTGQLIGIESADIDPIGPNQRPGETTLTIRSLSRGGQAESAGLNVGDRVQLVLDSSLDDTVRDDRPAADVKPGISVIRNERLVAQFPPSQLPRSADPVWATQVISAVLAAIGFFVLLGVERSLHWVGITTPGVLMLVGCIGYAVLRIVMEWVRVDEAGQFGTSLSISQWVSVVVIVISGGWLVARLALKPDPSPEP